MLVPESILVTSGMMSCNFFFSPRRCHGFDFNLILIPKIKDISQDHALLQLEAGYLGNLVTAKIHKSEEQGTSLSMFFLINDFLHFLGLRLSLGF